MTADRVAFRCGMCGSPLTGAAGTRTLCPRCGEAAVVPGDPFAERGLVPRTGPTVTGPTDLTLGGVSAAAWADWKRQVRVLAPAVALAGLLWGAAAAVAGFAGGLTLLVLTEAGVGDGGGRELAAVGVGLTGVWTAGALLTLVLADAHLEAARGGSRPARAYRTPRFGRAALCLTPLGPFAAALVAVPGWAAVRAGFPALTVPLTAAAGLMVPPVLFTLFWPVPFLIQDRPELRGVRPLLAAPAVGAGAWGGHIAVGLAAFVLTVAGPLAILGVAVALFGGAALLVAPLPLLAAPLGGLMLAHAYDRAERARLDRGSPPPVEPRRAGLP